MSKRYTNKFPTWAVIALVALALVFVASIGSQLLPWAPTTEQGTGEGGGTDDAGDGGNGAGTSTACTHENTSAVYQELDAYQHLLIEACSDCKKVLQDTEEAHDNNGAGGACSGCGYICDHSVGYSVEIMLTSSGEKDITYSTHKRGSVCKGCGLVKNTTVEMHNGLCVGGICTVCQYQCNHSLNVADFTITYDSGNHQLVGTCGNCGLTGTTTSPINRAHKFDEVGKCFCGYTCLHTGASIDFVPTSGEKYNENTSGTHTQFISCPTCDADIALKDQSCVWVDPVTGDRLEYCYLCDGRCSHSYDDPTYTNATSAGHDVVLTCTKCGWVSVSPNKEHTYKDSVCTVCQYECEEHSYINAGYNHDFNSVYITEDSVITHIEISKCEICGVVAENESESALAYGKSIAIEVGHGTCYYCNVCDAGLTDFIVSHTFEDGVCSDCKYECTHYYKADGTECLACGMTKETSETTE